MAKEQPSLNVQTKSTHMTITGTMNEEDDNVFLKVKISNKNGHTRNIYFPFDIRNDTAIEVANEMVKELEISDLEPLEIAEMIEEEISTIVPTWRGFDTSKYQRHHSFNYGEEDDISNHNAFFSPSSRSSSHGSLPMFCASFNNNTHLCGNHYSFPQDWSQDDHQYMNDDASSQSSINSYKCFNFHYNDSCNEDEQGSTHIVGEEPFCCNQKGNNKSTRFCPPEEMLEAGFIKQLCNMRMNSHTHKNHHGPNNRCPRLTRINSCLDVKKQQLQRSLMEEIQKRRMFNTVSAIENIGFQNPEGDGCFSC
jgi:WNK lysine deficient protein kinase